MKRHALHMPAKLIVDRTSPARIVASLQPATFRNLDEGPRYGLNSWPDG